MALQQPSIGTCKHLLRNASTQLFQNKQSTVFSRNSSYFLPPCNAFLNNGMTFPFRASLSTLTHALRFADAVKEAVPNSSALPQFSSRNMDLQPAAGATENETIIEKAYRWADVTGFLTRWYDRKAWIMDLEPVNRLATIQITEHERKLSIFMISNSILMFLLSMYLWIQAQFHFAVKPPCPQQPDFPYLDSRRSDFTWHGKIVGIFPRDRCKECRWLDSACKRQCFDKLKAEGHKFFVNGEEGPLTKPRFKLNPPHHHGASHGH